MNTKKLNEHSETIKDINKLIDVQLDEQLQFLTKLAPKALKWGKKAYDLAKTSPATVAITTNRIINTVKKKFEINKLKNELEDVTDIGRKTAIAAELKDLLNQLQKVYDKYPGAHGSMASKGYDIDGVGGYEYQIPYDRVDLKLDNSPVLTSVSGKKDDIRYKLNSNTSFNIIATKKISDGYILNLHHRNMPFDSILAFVSSLKPNKKQRFKLMGIKGKFRGDVVSIDGKLINFI